MEVIREFAPSVLRDLERNHAVVYEPFDTSIAKLLTEGRRFWFIPSQQEEFLNLTSRPTQVAIFPDRRQFYVPGSNDLSLPRQIEALRVDMEEVIKNNNRMGIGGVEGIIGDVATHCGLVFKHLDTTGVRLHGRDYGFRYGRTDTPTVETRVAAVGNFSELSGLYIFHWPVNRDLQSIWVVRLLLPAPV